MMYEAVPNWGHALPDPRGRDVSDVAVGPNDEVFVLYREPSFVVVSSPDGVPLRTFGLDVLVRPHGVTPGIDRVWVVDEGAHLVRFFDLDGNESGQVGNGPSDPAFPALGLHVDLITRPHPPFTRPTRLAVAPWGDLYVADGYGNCRIHQFASEGRLIRSWGEPGSGPGQLRIPHAVHVDSKGRVLVCDRENDRIQVLTGDGIHLEDWTGVQRPNAVTEGRDGSYYVAEGRHAVRPSPDPTRGPLVRSRIAVLDRDGRPLVHIGSDNPDKAGSFVSAHGMAVDSRGDVYVAECVASLRANLPNVVKAERMAVQKLRRL